MTLVFFGRAQRFDMRLSILYPQDESVAME